MYKITVNNGDVFVMNHEIKINEAHKINLPLQDRLMINGDVYDMQDSIFDNLDDLCNELVMYGFTPEQIQMALEELNYEERINISQT